MKISQVRPKQKKKNIGDGPTRRDARQRERRIDEHNLGRTEIRMDRQMDVKWTDKVTFRVA